MNNNGFNLEIPKKSGRAGSYWVPNPLEDRSYENSEAEEKSFYTKIQ